MIVKFRPMRAEDKELFKSFIRSLPRKDNYCLLIDVHDDQRPAQEKDSIAFSSVHVFTQARPTAGFAGRHSRHHQSRIKNRSQPHASHLEPLPDRYRLCG